MIKNILWTIVGAVIGAVIVLSFAFSLGNSEKQEGALGAEIPFNTLSVLNTSTTVTSTAVATLMASSSGAIYRSFTNLGAQPVYLSFGTSTFVSQTGYVLTPSSTLEMTEAKGNLFRNTIYATIDTGVATKVSMVQLK